MSPQTKNKHIRTDRCYQKHYRLLCFAGCNKYFITELETLAIANALQLEVARATPALSGFNYDAMLSLKSQNRRTLSYYSIFAADTLLCAVTLIFDLMTLNIALLVAFGSGMIFTKFDLRQLIRAWITAFLCWYVMSRCDLDLWPIDLESSWYIKRHVIRVCATFERNRAIFGWIIDNFAIFCTRYVTLWLWPLTSWPWTFTTLRVSYVKSLYKFERNWIIHRWVIDDLARFRRAILGGGAQLTNGS